MTSASRSARLRCTSAAAAFKRAFIFPLTPPSAAAAGGAPEGAALPVAASSAFASPCFLAASAAWATRFILSPPKGFVSGVELGGGSAPPMPG